MNSKVDPFSVEDIHTFLTGTAIDVPNIVVHIDAFAETGYNLDALFKGNHSIIVFLPNPRAPGGVGHFTLLTHVNDTTLEYFDSYAGSLPEPVKILAEKNGMKIAQNDVPLQGKTTNTCAKWCIARMFSLPLSLKKFQDIYTGHKTLSADVLVNNIFVLKVLKDEHR